MRADGWRRRSSRTAVSAAKPAPRMTMRAASDMGNLSRSGLVAQCLHPALHGQIRGRHGRFHETYHELVTQVGDADGARAYGQHLRVGQREAEAEDHVHRSLYAG